MKPADAKDTSPIKLPRTAKSKRPQYFADPATDKLLNMTINLLGEVCVMRDRIDTLERLLEAQGALVPKAAEIYSPTPEIEQERDARREAIIRRVMRPVEKELEETVLRKELPAS